MKTTKKALLLALCAVLLVVSTVFATMAYLTSTTQVVKNTFTVGNVKITLDEAEVDEYGENENGRTTEGNEYKLIPGHTYVKDPTIYVEKDSEDCWIFAKVVDGLGEASTIVINEGWTQVATTEDGGVVYAYGTIMSEGDSATVFDEFTFGDFDPAEYEDLSIEITGYAVQADGFNSATEAWAAAPATWGN